MKRLMLFTTLSISLVACAPSQTGGLQDAMSNLSLPWQRSSVSSATLVAAGVPAAEAYRQRLGVVAFSGNYGSQFGAELEGTLSGHTVDGQTYFSLVDRTNLDRVMAEIVRGSSGMLSSGTATKVGQLTGAQGILSGTAEARTDSRRVTKQRIKVQGGLGLKNVSCTENSAALTINVRLTSVKTGAVIYSKVIQKQATDDQCDGDLLLGVASQSELLRQVADAAAQQILFDLAPHEEKFNVRLLEAKDITPVSAANAYNSGLEFARARRMDRACELWNTAYTLNRTHYATLYAKGVCAEIEGSLSEALKWYTQADRTLTRPNSTISDAILRVQALLRSRK